MSGAANWRPFASSPNTSERISRRFFLAHPQANCAIPFEKRGKCVWIVTVGSPSEESCFSLHEPNHAGDCRQFVDWSVHTGWQTDYQQIGRGAFEGALTVTFAGDVQVNHCRFNRELVIHASPPEGSVSFVVPCSAGRRGVAQGFELEPQHVLMAPSGAEGFLKTAENLAYYVVVIPEGSFARALRGVSPGVELRSRSGSAISLPDAQYRSVVEILGSMVGRLECGGRVDLLDRLAHGVLGDAEEVPGPLRLRNRLQLVRRAKGYIEDHLNDGVTIPEVSEALEVSRRTLELAFRDVLDTSPLVYLRTRQLAKIRKALRENVAELRSTSISDLAARFGQTHPGYFSRDYKALFGELPSETVAGVRSS